jgi:hypothetical protein
MHQVNEAMQRQLQQYNESRSKGNGQWLTMGIRCDVLQATAICRCMPITPDDLQLSLTLS